MTLLLSSSSKGCGAYLGVAAAIRKGYSVVSLTGIVAESGKIAMVTQSIGMEHQGSLLRHE
jgi:hypothetical protein